MVISVNATKIRFDVYFCIIAKNAMMSVNNNIIAINIKNATISISRNNILFHIWYNRHNSFIGPLGAGFSEKIIYLCVWQLSVMVVAEAWRVS